jgi:hypothetical protein
MIPENSVDGLRLRSLQPLGGQSTCWLAVGGERGKKIAASRGGAERVKAQSDFSPCARAEGKIDTSIAVVPPWLLLLGGDGGGFHVAKRKTGRNREFSDFTARHLSGRTHESVNPGTQPEHLSADEVEELLEGVP